MGSFSDFNVYTSSSNLAIQPGDLQTCGGPLVGVVPTVSWTDVAASTRKQNVTFHMPSECDGSCSMYILPTKMTLKGELIDLLFYKYNFHY